jgi:hypothetical protein
MNRGLSAEKTGKEVMDVASGGRATLEETIYFHHVMNAQNTGKKFRDQIVPLGEARKYPNIPIGPVQHLVHRKQVAHRRYVTGDGTVPESHKDASTSAYGVQGIEMVAIGNGSFNKRDVDVFREVLYVGDRRVADIDKPGEIQQTLVQIEERHVATGAASQPGSGEAWFAHLETHSFLSRAVTI